MAICISLTLWYYNNEDFEILISCMSETKNIKVPLKILIPFRILGVLFGVITAVTFLGIFIFIYRNSFGLAFSYFCFTLLDGILTYGFWKMQKWITVILGSSISILAVFNVINVSIGAQKIGQAVLGLVILLVLFVFTYFSRSHLDGKYKDSKMISLFLTPLILSQIIILFLK
jgi:hypothetical protein